MEANKTIKFNKEELRDKIYACWLGKNIGGTLGAKYECEHKMNDCTGFSTKPGAPLPNDDLDLQLVWLKAVEEHGIDKINARLLGEYWLEYVTPHWNEYGICMANMKKGLVPPLCGQYNNHWSASNGAWIRTEVWACMFPGDVERTSKFSYEDACVDHGMGEGTFSAIMVASMQAAAFVINDIRKIIEIGLTKIPQDSCMYKYVTKVIECYDNKVDWVETRNIITDMSLNEDKLGWFQAPANVSYAIIGLLYGEGDFKKSMLMACNCGDDTDCTAATVGATLGIMHGSKIIPKDWQEYIGDSIVTISINMGDIHPADREFMYSCTALTDKIMELHPMTTKGSLAKVVENEDSDYSEITAEDMCGNDFAMSLMQRSEYNCEYESNLTKCLLEYSKAPEISPNETMTFKVSLSTKDFPSQKIYNIKWILPEGWSVEGAKSVAAMRPYKYISSEYKITAGEKVDSKNTLILCIECDAHYDILYVPVVLMG